MLDSMNFTRSQVSLSGFRLVSLQLGRCNGNTLRICERYLTSSDKWLNLPPLNIASQFTGSFLSQSLRCFCFCGSQLFKTYILLKAFTLEFKLSGRYWLSVVVVVVVGSSPRHATWLLFPFSTDLSVRRLHKIHTCDVQTQPRGRAQRRFLRRWFNSYSHAMASLALE